MKKTKTNKKTKPTTKKAVSAPKKSVANKKVEPKQVAPIKRVENKKVEPKQVASTTKAVAVTTTKSMKKPLIIAISVSAAVAAGLGVGGFFLGKNIGGGGGGGGDDDKTNFSVTLLPGEGNFEDKPYLTYKNVEKGTKLSSLTGYTYPTTIDSKDFDFWINSNGDHFVDTSTVENNLVLTASFTEGANYYKALTLSEIKEKLDVLTEAEAAGYIEAYNIVYDELCAVFADNAVEDAEQVKAIKNFADLALDNVLSYEPGTPAEEAAGIFVKYLRGILEKKVDEDCAVALLNTAAAYEKTKAVFHADLIDGCYNDLTNYLMSAKKDLLPTLNLLVPSVMENLANAPSTEFTLDIGKIEEAASSISSFKGLTDEQIEELVTFASNYIIAYVKADLSGQIDTVNIFYNDCLQSFAMSLDEQDRKDLYVTIYKLKFEGMAALANIGNASVLSQYSFEFATGLIDGIVDEFGECYEGMSADQLVPAREFALYGCNAVKNVTKEIGDFKSVYEALFEAFLNENNEPYKELYLTAIKSLVNIPNAEVQGSMKKDDLLPLLSDMSKAVEEAVGLIQEAEKKPISPIGIELIKIIQLAKIESCVYSRLDINLSKWSTTSLFGRIQTLINDCLGDKAEEKNRLQALSYAGALVGYSKLVQFLSKLGADVCTQFFNIQPLPNSIGEKLEGVFQEIDYLMDNAQLSEEQYAHMGNLLNGIFSSYPVRYRSYTNTNLTNLVQRINGVNSYLASNMKGLVSKTTALNNLLKHLYKLYVGGDYIFFYIRKDVPSVDARLTNENARFESFINSGTAEFLLYLDQSYFEKVRFDEIYATIQEEFYSKLHPDINMNGVITKLLTRVKNLVD